MIGVPMASIAAEMPAPTRALGLLPDDAPLALVDADGRAMPGDLDMPADGILLGAVSQDGAGPALRHPGDRPDQAGAAGGVPVGARPGGGGDRRGPGPARAGLAVSHLPRLGGGGLPGRRSGRGADAAARRLALRLRPVLPPRRAAVHAARDQCPARRGGGTRGPAQARGHGRPGHARRRGDQRRGHPRRAQLRGGVEGPGRVLRAEQRLRDQRPAGQADRGPDAGAQGHRLRHPRRPDRRQRRGRRVRRGPAGGGFRRGGRRPGADRGPDLPGRSPHQRRRRDTVPRPGRGGQLGAARSADPAPAVPDRPRPAR